MKHFKMFKLWETVQVLHKFDKNTNDFGGQLLWFSTNDIRYSKCNKANFVPSAVAQISAPVNTPNITNSVSVQSTVTDIFACSHLLLF